MRLACGDNEIVLLNQSGGISYQFHTLVRMSGGQLMPVVHA
jgi:hypothetical protein